MRYILCRSQQGQVLEPEVGLLTLRMPVLPGMDHLVGQPDVLAYETHRVLYAYTVYGRVH